MAKKIFTGKRLLFAAKSRVEVADWDVFEPQKGEVLFETLVSLVSPGTELSHLHDTHTKPTQYPTNSGYLSAGRIVKIGTGVEKWKPGDVVLSGLGHVSHAVFPESHPFVKVPHGMELRDAVWVKIATIPLWGVQKAAVRLGSTVAVFGLGAIGQMAAQLAKIAGGLPVIGVDLCQNRLDLAASLGITAVNGKTDVAAAVKEATDGYGLDCIIEATGTPHVAHSLFEHCAHGATISILGGVHKPVPLDLYTHFQKKCLTMVGAHTSGTPNEADSFYPYSHEHNIRFLMKAIQTGLFNVRAYTSKFVSYEEGPAMFKALSDPESGVLDVVFDWSEVAQSSNLLK
ncbi:MAG: zinc-binding alcohol dehydrogenase [Planctomycetes bacterium]|nr:zinc-binding alcohol dehydrogenase [Planctomycetota bacterium]